MEGMEGIEKRGRASKVLLIPRSSPREYIDQRVISRVRLK